MAVSKYHLFSSAVHTINILSELFHQILLSLGQMCHMAHGQIDWLKVISLSLSFCICAHCEWQGEEGEDELKLSEGLCILTGAQ